jgi:RNA polymerase sigma-70 factor (ECF subfamily)
MDDVDLAERMARAKAGDELAIRELLGRFEDEVRLVIRGRLPRSLRSKFDSMDFVQSVWQDVFTAERLDPERFENAKHLLGYLAGVARNKVNEEHRRRTQTHKYNLRREEPLYVRRGDREVPREVAASDPSPSQDAQAKDRLAQLLQGRSPLERQVVELRRRGLTYADIGEQLGMHESAVRRIVDSIRQALESRRWR